MIDELDLAEVVSSVLTGVTVGVGSLILVFGNGVTLLIQCPFKSESKGKEQWGHGEEVHASVILFDFLNCKVEGARLEGVAVLVLDFGSIGSLTIAPESNGLESYVLTTKLGISPISVS